MGQWAASMWLVVLAVGCANDAPEAPELPTARWVDAARFGLLDFALDCGLTDAGVLRCDGMEPREGVTVFGGGGAYGGMVCAIQPEAQPTLSCETVEGPRWEFSAARSDGDAIDFVTASAGGLVYVLLGDGQVIAWSPGGSRTPQMGLPPLQRLIGVGERLCGVDTADTVICTDVNGNVAPVDAEQLAVTLYDVALADGTTIGVDGRDLTLDLDAELGWTALAGLAGRYLTLAAWSPEGDVIAIDPDAFLFQPVQTPEPVRSVRPESDALCAILDSGAIACGEGAGADIEPLEVVSAGASDPDARF